MGTPMRIMTIAFVLLLSSVSAFAADKSCDGTTVEMVKCLKAKTALWDKRLNDVYQYALIDAGEQGKQLRKAERLWIKYRDANCLYYDLGGGTIARIDAAECMRRMTEARAKELESYKPMPHPGD